MTRHRALLSVVFGVWGVGIAALPASGQAWVAPAGVGAVSVVGEAVNNTGHVLTDGSVLPVGKSRDVSVYVETSYAVTDRLSVVVGVPYVFARYLGPGVIVGNQPVDICGCWNHAWQDLSGTARVSLSNGSFGLTPSVGFGAPTHDYAYRGEAVVGRGLNELRLAVDAGQRLDAISSTLAVSGQYQYTIVQRVLDIPNNKSNVSLDLAYTPNRRWSVQGTLLWQRTHGGLRAGTGPPPPVAPLPWGEIATEAEFEQHDRLLRDNNFRVAASLSCALSRVEVFGSFTKYVSGTNTHAGYVVAAGVTIPFEIDR